MQPLFRSIVVGIIPVPRQVPPAALDRDKLQRAYFDITATDPYAQFALLPADSGAQLLNTPDDRVLLQPQIFQLQSPVDMTAQRATEKAVRVLKAAAERLEVQQFALCGIKVVAHVPAPSPAHDARGFVTEHLLAAPDRAEELGAGFFTGGVKFRRVEDGREDNLVIEPLILNNEYIFVDYDVQRGTPFQGVDPIGDWIEESFNFVTVQAMRALEA